MQKVDLTKISLAMSGKLNAYKKGDDTAANWWIEKINAQLANMPSGAGIDRPITMDHNRSTIEKFVFNVHYHHMDENGYYCGWTTFVLTVTPSFWQGVAISIKNGGTGLERRERYMVNDTKEYLLDLFSECFEVSGN